MSDNQEPSMEEILASIRKIISEDGEEEGEPAPAPEPEPEPEPEPLELEEEVEEEPLELEDEVEEPPDIEMVEVEDEPPPPPASLPDDDRIVSDRTSDLSTAQFATLERSIRMGQAGETLEDIVKGLLRPMLRSWLDENLPGLVERLVQEEIEYMSQRARRKWWEDD